MYDVNSVWNYTGINAGNMIGLKKILNETKYFLNKVSQIKIFKKIENWPLQHFPKFQITTRDIPEYSLNSIWMYVLGFLA